MKKQEVAKTLICFYGDKANICVLNRQMNLLQTKEYVDKAIYIAIQDGKFIQLIYQTSDDAKNAINSLISTFPYSNPVGLGIKIESLKGSIVIKSANSPIVLETTFIPFFPSEEEDIYNEILDAVSLYKNNDLRKDNKKRPSIICCIIEDGEFKVPYIGESDNTEEQILGLNIIYFKIA